MGTGEVRVAHGLSLSLLDPSVRGESGESVGKRPIGVVTPGREEAREQQAAGFFFVAASRALGGLQVGADRERSRQGKR